MILGKYNKPFKNGTSLLSKIIHSNYFKLKPFKVRIPINIETQKYLIKTAENNFELNEALILRHKVFSQEILRKRNILKIDIDKYDKHCDHILIIDKTKNETIATYRINLNIKDFYSSHEFDISNLIIEKGIKAELGRACIKKEYRKGLILGLLWKGIKEYVEQSNIKYLFGCSSIFTDNPNEALIIFDYFKNHNFIHKNILVKPRNKYSLKSLINSKKFKNRGYYSENSHIKLPDLLKAYLKYGAKICSYPAYDREFKCIDFLTIIDYHNINEKRMDIINKL